MHNYTEEEMLLLSGIQHYMFCPRQWALIHIEQQWNDNRLTIEGKLLHKNVDNPFVRETNGSDIITIRGLNLSSYKLGLIGIADAVELHPLQGAPKKKSDLLSSHQFTALPIEYKRGKRKTNDCDRVQVAAQAMILEEIFGIGISCGAIFYWEERHREYIEITDSLKKLVNVLSDKMHKTARLGVTPPAQKTNMCKSCSLNSLCLPTLCGRSVRKYLSTTFDEKVT